MGSSHISEELEPVLNTTQEASANLYLSFADESNDNIETSELNVCQSRLVYLITYRKADLKTFPKRPYFTKAVIDFFQRTGSIPVNYWTCCFEPYQKSGAHFHLAISLKRAKRWKSVKDDLHKFGISVHFVKISWLHCSIPVVNEM